MNQGMPPYKGKKVVYYEDPRFKNKAFMKIPNIEWIMKQIKTLPSNAKTQKLLKEIVTVKKTEKKTDLPEQDLMFKTETVKPIEQAISEIEAIEVTRVIPAEFDVFAED